MRALAPALALVLLAGCLAPAATPAPEEVAAATVKPDARGFALSLVPVDPLAAAPSLAAPPAWASGDWWRYKVTEEIIEREPYEVTIVVAGAEGDHWLVGMPADAFVSDALILHLPGVGEVSRADGSYIVHGEVFHPLQFPLDEGDSWETSFEGQPASAKVASVQGTTAVVEIDGVFPMTVEYDALVGAPTKIAAEGYALLELVGSGRGFVGEVSLPHGHALDLRYRIGPAVGPGPAPALPVERFEIGEEYDRLALALLVIPIPAPGGTLPGNGGVYREKATGPDGTVYELQVLPTQSGAFHLASFDVKAPAGPWTLEHLAGGAGIVGAELVYYHEYHVTLPEGTVSSPESGHAH